MHNTHSAGVESDGTKIFKILLKKIPTDGV